MASIVPKARRPDAKADALKPELPAFDPTTPKDRKHYPLLCHASACRGKCARGVIVYFGWPARFCTGHPSFNSKRQLDLVLKEVPQTIHMPGNQMGMLFAEVCESEPAQMKWNGGIALGAARSDDCGEGG